MDTAKTAPAPDLDGRTFVGVSNSDGGTVDADTRFTYHQDGDTVWAEYAGGAVARGFLVGTRTGEELRFRYVHLEHDRTTASGRCTSRLVVRPGAPLELHEEWTWESRPGSGRSVIAEVPG